MEYEGHRRDGDASSWWRQSRKLVHHFHIRTHTNTHTHAHDTEHEAVAYPLVTKKTRYYRTPPYKNISSLKHTRKPAPKTVLKWSISLEKTATSKMHDRYSTTPKSAKCIVKSHNIYYSTPINALFLLVVTNTLMFVSDTLMFNNFLSSHFQAKSVFHLVTRQSGPHPDVKITATCLSRALFLLSSPAAATTSMESYSL